MLVASRNTHKRPQGADKLDRGFRPCKILKNFNQSTPGYRAAAQDLITTAQFFCGKHGLPERHGYGKDPVLIEDGLIAFGM
ncbi:hypothetical protein PGQ11_007873 [Apiospora arundinis]|uniref:Uncharacterized protein n=1 Tax=Apiospora arundinis TaxID=335852 RepID=A0ABR2IXH6_9PEZI